MKRKRLPSFSKRSLVIICFIGIYTYLSTSIDCRLLSAHLPIESNNSILVQILVPYIHRVINDKQD